LIERMDVYDHWAIRSAIEEDIPSVLDLWAAGYTRQRDRARFVHRIAG
jgi:hypothetical protein